MSETLESIRAEFINTPYDIYSLRGKKFNVIEDINISGGKLRSATLAKEFNGVKGKPYKAYLLTIEEGIIQKDLGMNKAELAALMTLVPSSVKNMKGTMFEVDLNREIKYLGSMQNGAGNDTTGQCTPAHATTGQQQTAPTEIGRQIEQLASAIELQGRLQIRVTPELCISIADTVRPGDALRLIKEAKDAGWIFEQGGVYRRT